MSIFFVLFALIRLVCSDWKFLAILLGLSDAKAKYFCIWCRCSKEQILDFLSECYGFLINGKYGFEMACANLSPFHFIISQFTCS